MMQIEYQADRQNAFRFSGGGYPCPQCNSGTGWSYIRNFGREYGMCFACGHKHFPKPDAQVYQDRKLPVNEPVAFRYIPLDTVEKTLTSYHLNPFVSFLNKVFGSDKVQRVLSQFKIGTAKKNGTVFWYIDRQGLFRKPKVMYYGITGKRIKDEPGKQTNCAGFTNTKGYSLPLYGEHQLNTLLYPEDTPVLLVESEKSACIGYAVFPQYIWLATGGSTCLNPLRASVLKGRKVVIVPDADEVGREGACKSHQVLQKIGIDSTIADLFPGKNDHTDIADYITGIYTKLYIPEGKKRLPLLYTNQPTQLQSIETLTIKYPVITYLIDEMDLKILDVKQT